MIISVTIDGKEYHGSTSEVKDGIQCLVNDLRAKLATAHSQLEHLENWRARDGQTIDLLNPEAQVQPIIDKLAAAEERAEKAEAVILQLRRRIHFAEKHNQMFNRCESAWCHPGPDNDPAIDAVKFAAIAGEEKA